MAQIKSVKRKSKNGLAVEICTPVPGEGRAILETVHVIMSRSAHLLTSAEEFQMTVEQEEQLIAEYLKNPDAVLIVPKVENRIVGMMNFMNGRRKRASHQGEFGMSVHPDYQGQGIGRMMLAELIAWARENPNIETVRLRVHSKNQQALALYRSFNFQEEGREIRGIKMGEGHYDDVILMALHVS